MYSGPSYTKPTHSYGEASPVELEPPAEHAKAPYVPGHGWFCCCGRTWPCPFADSNWAGKGFDRPYTEDESAEG